MRQVAAHPRPSNHTKIYGSGYKSFGTGGPEDGVERFWRNIIGGSVGLDLSGASGVFEITWISIAMGVRVRTSAAGGYRLMDKTTRGGSVVTVSAPYKGGWVAAIVRK